MSKERLVNTKFWDDNYISELEPMAKYLYIYFLTNPLTEICGVYELPMKTMISHTGLEKEVIFPILKTLEKSKKAYYVDGWLALPNFIKNQHLNPSICKGIERSLKLIPKPVLDRLGRAWVQAVRACIQPSGYLNPNLNPNPNLKRKKKKEKSASPDKSGGSGAECGVEPGPREGKPHFWGCEMRHSEGKWWVIPKDRGKWKEFTEKEDKIEWY